VDSRKVAALFNVAHQHFRERIEEFETEMTQLGVFQFETGKPLKGRGFNPDYWIKDKTERGKPPPKPSPKIRERKS
jgi:hypothetical protein